MIGTARADRSMGEVIVGKEALAMAIDTEMAGS